MLLMPLKGGFEEKDSLAHSQLKKFKSDAKVSNFQFKGNKVQFQFNSSLLDSFNSRSAHSLEGNLAAAYSDLESAKGLQTEVPLVGRLLKNTNLTSWQTILKMKRNFVLLKGEPYPSYAEPRTPSHLPSKRTILHSVVKSFFKSLPTITLVRSA